MANGLLGRKTGIRYVMPSIAWGGFIFSILPLLPFDFWMLALADHFRMHYVLLAALALIFSLWLKQFRYVFGIFFIAGLNLYVMSPWDWARPSLNHKHDGFSVPSQSLIWLNVHSDNEAKQEVIDYLLDKNADLILLSEVNDQWIQSMEVLNKRWPYQILHPREDNFGMAVFSRFEFDSHARLKLEAFEVPAVEMILRFRDGKTLAVFAVHPVPPIGKNHTQSRDNYLANLSRHLHGQEKPCIVIGDFNATPWHPPVRRLLNQHQLMYALPGSSMFPSTWPSVLPGMGIPIDLCLVDRSIRLLDHQVGPRVGSDHRPLELQFTLE